MSLTHESMDKKKILQIIVNKHSTQVQFAESQEQEAEYAFLKQEAEYAFLKEEQLNTINELKKYIAKIS